MSLEAFKERVLPAKDKLYRFALKLVHNHDEAMDIVQDVLLKVWDDRGRMSEVNNMEAWCMRMVRNLSYDRLKSSYVKKTDSMPETFDIATESSTPETKTEIDDAMTRIHAFIEELPEKQKQVIHLRDVEGFSYKEIGDILEIDVNQVKVSLFRARKAVKEKFITINTYGL